MNCKKCGAEMVKYLDTITMDDGEKVDQMCCTNKSSTCPSTFVYQGTIQEYKFECYVCGNRIDAATDCVPINRGRNVIRMHTECYKANFCSGCNKNVNESEQPWHTKEARLLDISQPVGVIHYACESF